MDDETKAVCSLFIKELATNIRDISLAVHQLTNELHTHAMTIQNLQSGLDTANTTLAKLNSTVRDGNGQPSLITRVAVLEEHMKNYDVLQDDIKKNQCETDDRKHSDKQMERTLRWTLIGAIISGLLGAIGGAISIFGGVK